MLARIESLQELDVSEDRFKIHDQMVHMERDNSLAYVNPEVTKQWHPTKNGNLGPEHVLPNSNKKVWWICQNGHEWEAEVYRRNKGSRCAACSGKIATPENCLAALNPDLAAQWHPTKNEVTPFFITPGSDMKAWWACEKGHEWQALVYSRSKRSNCPFCSNKMVTEDNCLATLYPEIAKEWHPTKNQLTPYEVVPGSGKKVWWKCGKYGHEWEATLVSRIKSGGCPYCRGKRLSI